MILHLDLPQNGYDIILERGALAKAGEYLDLNRRVLVVTDSGVPKQYAETVAAQCKSPTLVTVPMGEGSKCFERYRELLSTLLSAGFTRTDCVVAVGGGVVGDLAGFVAATYMRGIDFYNIPTTLLSQVDSSIGGKVAIDLDGVKNIVGAFYQPKGVLIDPEVLATLPSRQLACGFAEALKMSLTSDTTLFSLFEEGRAVSEIDEVIYRSLCIKKTVVEKDEKENGLRRILNFGHTLGHGIETVGAGRLLHGECVALGMLPMCADELRVRLLPILSSLGLPTVIEGDVDSMLAVATHDKKRDGESISSVYVPAPGLFEIRREPMEAWCRNIKARVAALNEENKRKME